MIYAKDIPPEIWSLIFDFTLDASVTAHEICNYHNFPQLNQHLLYPWIYPPVDNSWGNLRLVCRGFNELAGKSPHCFLRGQQGFFVPAGTRVSYITALENVMACMERLVESPIKHHQIATFNITRGYAQNPKRADPLQFLEYAPAFPSIRTLALDLSHTFNASLAWRRLNAAFPILTCLVLRGARTDINTPPTITEPVVFECVEILEIDRLTPGFGLEFPRLRYLSLQRFSESEVNVIAGWQGIEALMFRRIQDDVPFDWNHLPQLRMLGLPVTHLHFLASCPVDHPLSNLCIFYWGSRQVSTIIERRSATIRVVVDRKSLELAELNVIARACAAAGLDLADSPYNRFQRAWMHMATKIPRSITEIPTQCGVAVITGLALCFVCGYEIEKWCGSLGRRRAQN